MEFKRIDCKNKEIYFNIKPIEEDSSVLESRFMFWDTLNSFAVKNMVIQKMRMA